MSKLPRILAIDEPDGYIDVVCDPDMPAQEVTDWLVNRDPQTTFDEADGLDDRDGYQVMSFKEVRHPDWYRWLPMEYESYSHMLFPAKGKGRGAFFVRFFEVEWKEQE